jgi:hypothetical protein
MRWRVFDASSLRRVSPAEPKAQPQSQSNGTALKRAGVSIWLSTIALVGSMPGEFAAQRLRVQCLCRDAARSQLFQGIACRIERGGAVAFGREGPAIFSHLRRTE